MKIIHNRQSHSLRCELTTRKNYCHSPTRFDCNKLEVTDVLDIIAKKYSQFTLSCCLFIDILLLHSVCRYVFCTVSGVTLVLFGFCFILYFIFILFFRRGLREKISCKILNNFFFLFYCINQNIYLHSTCTP